MKILIVGAGIGGRALARGLEASRAHHDVTLIEKRGPEPQRHLGSVLTIDPNGFAALEALDPVARRQIQDRGLQAPAFELLHARDASPLTTPLQVSQVDFEERYGFPRLVVPRDILVSLLEPRDTTIQHHHPFSERSSEFRDADLVIGADGMRSRVRELVKRDSLRFRGVLSDGGQARLADCPVSVREFVGEHPLFMAVWRASTLFVTLNPESNTVVWSVAYRSARFAAAGCAADRRHLDLLVADWDERLRAIVALPTSRPTRAYFDRDPLCPYHAGHIALLGDAAHPMTPYQGQGANMALEDAATLARLLLMVRSPSQLPSMLEHYSSDRSRRANALQMRSRQSMSLFHTKNRLSWALRGMMFFALRHIGSRGANSRDEELFSWTLASVGGVGGKKSSESSSSVHDEVGT